MAINSLAFDHSLWSVLLRFSVNLITLFIIIRLIYYRFNKTEDNVFSFFVIGITIFLICSLLETVEIQIGMALGLFAIFAILRFRTINLPVKDMTYIFSIIGVSVINALANIPPPITGAVLVNSIIIFTIFFLELFLQQNAFSKQLVIYDKIEFLTPGYKNELLKKLSALTGKKVEKINILKIDIKRGIAELEIFFRDKRND